MDIYIMAICAFKASSDTPLQTTGLFQAATAEIAEETAREIAQRHFSDYPRIFILVEKQDNEKIQKMLDGEVFFELRKKLLSDWQLNIGYKNGKPFQSDE